MKYLRRYGLDSIAMLVVTIVFIVPFLFIVLMAVKSRQEAAKFSLSWPTSWHALENMKAVFKARDGMFLRAMWNSLLLTVFSVALLVVIGAMVGFMLDRRRDHVAKAASGLVFVGLMLPPAIVPTIFVMQKLHIFKTLHGMVLVEVAFNLPFVVLLFRAFCSTIPRDLDEAAMIDGCTGFSLFRRVIFPLLRPVIITVILTTSVFVYNDFVNPLYFLPGSKNATAQTTLFVFQSQFNTSWNLLFMDVLLITIPPLVLFIFFNRKIVAGMTAGSVKG